MSYDSVLQYFYEIATIPRPSKQEEQIIAWLIDFAKSHGYDYKLDQVGNLVIKVPAPKEASGRPTVVLQAHVDMVCEKSPESKHDFSKDSLVLEEKDGWLTAKGTTLGADNGIGIALALAAAEGIESHGPLELLFTVDEETGLTGAANLEAGFIEGDILINLDSEDHGVLIIGCAGGTQLDILLPLKEESIDPALKLFKVACNGFMGGHSGININGQRVNAIKLLAEVLHAISSEIELRVATIDGGTAHNAIPRDAYCHLWLSAKEKDLVETLLGKWEKQTQHLYPKEQGFSLRLSPQTEFKNKGKLLAVDIKKGIDLLKAIPHGVYRHEAQNGHLVETSSTLARVCVIEKLDQSFLSIMSTQRSSKIEMLGEITSNITAICQLAGAQFSQSGFYPPWQPDLKSGILGKCQAIYRDLFHVSPTIEIIHAGLECGIIGEKFPHLEMISFGPTIKNPHSLAESLDLKTVDKTWQFLHQILTVL